MEPKPEVSRPKIGAPVETRAIGLEFPPTYAAGG